MKKGIVCACLLVLLCCACAAPAEKAAPVEITMYHGWIDNNVDSVAMREIFEGFNEQQDEVHLNLVALNSSQSVIERAEELYAVGKVPDIISTSDTGSQEFYDYIIANHYALDLTPYIEEDPDFAADISPLTRSRWSTEDGALFSVTDVLLMSGYWYNAELFAAAGIGAPPVTWEEFRADCEALAAAGTDGFYPVVSDSMALVDMLDAVLASTDPDMPEDMRLWSQEGFDFSDPRMTRGLEDFRDLYRTGWVNGQMDNFVDAADAFNQGKAAMLLGGVWNSVYIDEDIHAAFAPFPSSDGRPVSCVSAGINYILGDTGDPEKEEACVRFLKYMLRDDIQEKLAVLTGQMPSNPSVSLEALRERVPLLYSAMLTASAAEIQIEWRSVQWRNDADALDYLTDNWETFFAPETDAGGFARKLAQIQ